MNPDRDRLDQQAPEVVNPAYPEAVQFQYPFRNDFQPQQTGSKAEDGAGPHSSFTTSNYGSPVNRDSPQAYHASAVGPQSGNNLSDEKSHGMKNRGLLCGCTTAVFMLSAIIAFLLAAVIGLAAGTGVEANRANNAEAKVSSLSRGLTATVTATTTVASASSTSFAALDDNCSGNPSGVSGTTYDVFSLIADTSFTIRCNADALGNPLLSLFTSTLNTCMDACASYTKHITASFGNSTNTTTNTNTTCGAVSFIPLWTNKTAALVGGAPGNCYLKPTQTGAPNTPNIGTECHAGILVAS